MAGRIPDALRDPGDLLADDAARDVQGERIRYTDNLDDPNLPGEMQATISLKRVSCGTELTIVQAGLPAVIPPEACLGWQESLTLLAKLAEAEISD